ncbi:hypothetical protein [Bacillus sp. FJAT-45066]|uniref:hypothetical protein n=1 Tax=Bacillus sp. FJAT-45066 TaxID=2011010 RepID=UPI0011413349|nr:hypothetical protein [Bacillus sp. FJAT-45066]
MLILVGCSNVESTNKNDNEKEVITTLKGKIADLEKELFEQSRTLAETEKEVEELKSNENLVYKDGEFIKIPIETAPSLHANPDIQLWELVSDFLHGYELLGYERGETNWREWDGEIGEPFMPMNESWETPGQLISNWVNYHGFSFGNGIELLEVTMRVVYDYENEVATGYVLTFGYGDDSVAGSVRKVLMKQEEDYWYIENVHIRNQCYRNVSEDGELCV